MPTTPTAQRVLRWVLAAFLGMAAVVGFNPPARADEAAPTNRVARYEVDFMKDMIDHHQMASMMSQMCLEKAVHPELRAMCQQIIAAQQAEISQLQGWLNDWYAVDYEPQPRNGAVRSMQRLERLEGGAFEIAFMETMTRHHRKAIAMAQKCLDKAVHPELVAMCSEIIETQTAEIQQLERWLCEWYDRCTSGRYLDRPEVAVF